MPITNIISFILNLASSRHETNSFPHNQPPSQLPVTPMLHSVAGWQTRCGVKRRHFCSGSHRGKPHARLLENAAEEPTSKALCP